MERFPGSSLLSPSFLFSTTLTWAQTGEVNATPTTIIGAFIFVCLSLVGLMGWLLRHLFVTTIPAIVADQKEQREAHEADQKAQRETSEASLTEVCEAFKQESQAERKLCAEQFTLVNASLAALTAVINQDRSAIVAQINQHTTEAMAQYRHDLYDKMNEIALGKEIAALQKAKRQGMTTPEPREPMKSPTLNPHQR